MTLDSTVGNPEQTLDDSYKSGSPTEQLELFSSKSGEISKNTQSNIDELILQNNFFSNSEIDLFLVETKNDKNIIKAKLKCKLENDEIENKYYDIICHIDTLKKFVYFEYDSKRVKGLKGVKIHLQFILNYKEILGKLIDLNDEELKKFHCANVKPKDLANNKISEKNNIEKFPKLDIKLTSIKRTKGDEDCFDINFLVNEYEFRIKKINLTQKRQTNGDYNDQNILISFDKNCLHQIGVKINGIWSRFSNKKKSVEDYTRSEISKFLFNYFNGIEFKSFLDNKE